MHENDATPGNVVLLPSPFKPDRAILHFQEELNKMLHATGSSYDDWNGFTHGVILIYDRDRVCYLALYDAITGFLYLDVNEEIPVRVEYTLDELTLFKRIHEWPEIALWEGTKRYGSK